MLFIVGIRSHSRNMATESCTAQSVCVERDGRSIVASEPNPVPIYTIPPLSSDGAWEPNYGKR